MKRIFSMIGILTLSAFLLSSFSLRENPQDPPRGKKTERHIKISKVDDEGNKIELDTIVNNDEPFVWNGDTIGGDSNFKWLAKDIDLDSQGNMNFDIDISDDDAGNVFMVKSGGKGFAKSWQVQTDGDSTKEYTISIVGDDNEPGDIMMWHGANDGAHTFVMPPVPPVQVPPVAPKMMFFGKDNAGNVIDLSDPGVISFKKKKLSGGREKITIIRNEPDENVKNVEEIIVTGKGNKAMFFGDSPKVEKVIVTGSPDKRMEVIEDTDVMHLDKGDGKIKVIQEDGKKIIIREIKEGDEKKVEVNVEVEEEGQENN